MGAQPKTAQEDAFRRRLLADYDRLIAQIEGTMANGVAKSFIVFLTAMEGTLVAAALRAARQAADVLSMQEKR